MEPKTNILKAETKNDEILNTARELLEYITPGEYPHIVMWCNFVLSHDGKNIVIPSLFTRIIKTAVRHDVKPLEFILYGLSSARYYIDGTIYPEQCRNCGRWNYRGGGLCDVCILLLKSCAYCGRLITFDDDLESMGYPVGKINSRIVDGRKTQLVCCPTCDKTKYTICDNCHNKAERHGAGYGIENPSTGKRLIFCHDCISDNSVVYCRRCNNYHKKDSTTMINGNRYCIECALKESLTAEIATVHGHDYKPSPIFVSTTADHYVPLGVELEVDDGQQTDKLMRFLKSIVTAYAKTDGSLSSSDAMEIVTHPLSLQAHKTLVPYQELFRMLNSEGYTSHNNRTCGAHVHIGRTAFGTTPTTQNKCIARFIYLVEKFQGEFITFSRRRDFSYCRFFNLTTTGKTTMEIYRRAKDINAGSRYTVVNLQNRGTIEFRLFKGTLNLPSYFAMLELCEYMAKYVVKNKTDEHYQNLTWSQFARAVPQEYPMLRNYMAKKALL